MKQSNKQQLNSKTRLAYIGFLFQTFLKRPFGYIIGVLYVVYLAVILLIVPAVIHQPALFIWNNSMFKMPIFNLFFIAAATSSMAVAIFRIGREDGTDLALSAKPLTKNDTVWIKTLVYVLIMLIFIFLSVCLVSLIMPVFGVYDPVKNPNGILQSKYIGILLAIFVGNLVNMLLFGGIAVLISMVGGQVITMIGTIGVAFLMCLMNFIYPRIIVAPYDVITNNFNTTIQSYKIHTLDEYENQISSSLPLAYCAIQCHSDAEEGNIDTKEGWDLANQMSGSNVINYIDFAKQLATLYQAFGLEELRIEDAEQLFIGASNEYRYDVDGTTCIASDENVELKKYPIACYSMSTSQGMIYPTVHMLGANVGDLSLNNWYIRSRIMQVDFNATSVVTSSWDSYSPVLDSDLPLFDKKPWKTMDEMYLNTEQKNAAQDWLNAFFEDDRSREKEWEIPFRDWMLANIFNPENPDVYERAKSLFFPGKEWANLEYKQKYEIVTKIHLYWATLAQKHQIEMIKQYWLSEGEEKDFPFNSNDVTQWYKNLDDDDKKVNLDIQRIINYVFTIDAIDKGTANERCYFSKLITSELDYPETYNNLYSYSITPCYSIYGLVAGWSIISIAFFASSIIVYKKTDFK